MMKRSYRNRTHHVHSYSSDSRNSGKELFLPLTWSRKMSGTISRRTAGIFRVTTPFLAVDQAPIKK